MAAPLLQLVSNPASGTYDPARIAALRAALEAEGFAVELATSSAGKGFVPDPRAAHVCVAGGDGTVRHVAGALAVLDKPPAFSVYPMGTINLVAREWNVPRDPHAFARHVVDDGARRTLHVANCNATHFVACASIGPDSRAVALVSEALKARIGRVAYGLSLMRVLADWQPPKLRVTIDGVVHACEALYIANGRFYAGPWVVAPKACLAASSLQVAMLKHADRFACLRFLFSVVTGTTHRLANVTVVEARDILIESDIAVPVQLDGDEGAALPVRISLGGAVLNG